jgi:hypothetical protein
MEPLRPSIGLTDKLWNERAVRFSRHTIKVHIASNVTYFTHQEKITRAK